MEVIIVSIHDDDQVSYEALKSGASWYLAKCSNHLEILHTLEEIAKGRAAMSGKIARLIEGDIRCRSCCKLKDHESLVLPPPEYLYENG
jgi:DNA-binding NarL/FixJ family response regulator